MRDPAEPSLRRRALFAGLLLLACVLAVGTAGWGALYNETDGQYGGAARIMADGGSWIVPENNGIPRLVKPPLLYWEMASAMKLFGVSPFSARLPGAVAIVVMTLFTALIAERIGGTRHGLLAGVMLVTTVGMFSLGRIVMPEQTLAALVTGALYFLLRGHDDPGRRRTWFAAFWVCASLASFVKGWHGTLYPLVIAACAALACPEARPRLRGLLSWEGLAIFLLINVPWYVVIESRFPGWFHNLTFTEQLGHVEGNSSPATDYTSVPRWQFLLLHLAWFAPWSIVVFASLAAQAGRVSLQRRPARSFASALIVSWAVVVLGSVLLAGQRQDYYAMTMWPAAAIAGAWVLDRFSVRPGAVALAVLLGLGWLVAFFLPVGMAGESRALAERATAWTTVAGFDASVWASLRVTGLWALGGGFLGAVSAAILPRRPWPGLVAAAVSLALGATAGTALVAPYFSLSGLAPHLPPGARVVFEGGIDTGSSLLFYTDATVLLLGQNPDEEFITRTFGIGRERFLDTESVVRAWKAGEPLWLVTESRRLDAWRRLLDPRLEPVARSGTSILLKN